MGKPINVNLWEPVNQRS